MNLLSGAAIGEWLRRSYTTLKPMSHGPAGTVLRTSRAHHLTIEPGVTRTALIALIVVTGFLLRLAPMADDPLHPDECLYASWALLIHSGQDPLLSTVAVDKPPVFPYLLAAWMSLTGTGAVSVRLLGATAAVLGLLLFYALASRVYGFAPALSGLVMMSLSPVAIALDATAFMDPVATALALTSVYLGTNRRVFAAGIFLGLAVATKPTILAYIPLLVSAVLWYTRCFRRCLRLIAGFVPVWVGVAAWEVSRNAATGFLPAMLANYGDGAGNGNYYALLESWVGLLRWIWGTSSALYFFGLLSLVAVLFVLLHKGDSDNVFLPLGTCASLLLAFTGILLFQMPAWDRYALAFIPLFALILTWAIATVTKRLSTSARTGNITAFLIAGCLLLFLLPVAQEATRSMLPLGDTSHWAGIDDIAAYVRGQVPGRATVFYRDYGWHLRYYMFDFPQDFRWLGDADLVTVLKQGAYPAYMLLPAGEEGGEDRQALAQGGYAPETLICGYRHDGHPSMCLYRVEEEMH